MSKDLAPYFQTYSPRVRVLIKDAETARVLYDASDDLASISTNKAYGRCSGTWQMMLPPTSIKRKNSNGGPLSWYDVLEPDQMVTIEMEAGNGAGFFPVMCGLIDRKSRVFNKGSQPQRMVKVSGRDMGKLLEVHDVAFDIIASNRKLAAQDGTEKSEPASLTRIFDQGITTGSPAYIITKMYDICVSQMLGTTKRMAFVSDCQDSFLIHQQNLMTSQGVSFWQYAKQIEHAPFNILTTETARGNVDSFLMILEQMPINVTTGTIDRTADKWHTITPPEIVAEDLGVSDHERINLLSYQPIIIQQGEVMGYDVMMAHEDLTRLDDASVKTHGLCPHVFRDQFLPPEMEHLLDADQQHTIDAINTAAGASEILWNRYRNNHTYESGTLSVHLRPDIRAGNGLLVQRDGKYMEYLIEQVSHSCLFQSIPPVFETTLQLTRGQKTTPNNQEQAGPPQPAAA